MEKRVDYTLTIAGTPTKDIGEVKYNFGELGDMNIGELGLGAGGDTLSMSIPEYADFAWVTLINNEWHKITIPIRENINESMRGKILLVELQGTTLNLYIEERLPHFQSRKKKIFTTTAP